MGSGELLQPLRPHRDRGDFCDAIPLVDGRLVLVVGDVMGRGVDAAAAMAETRAAVRAYTVVDPTPRVVTRKLDLMYRQYSTQQMVTVAYMLLDPSRDDDVAALAALAAQRTA